MTAMVEQRMTKGMGEISGYSARVERKGDFLTKEDPRRDFAEAEIPRMEPGLTSSDQFTGRG
jgi:ribosomal protein L16/L10AE